MTDDDISELVEEVREEVWEEKLDGSKHNA